MNEALMHYGVKGMKWGVRRTPQQLGHAIAKKPVPSLMKKQVKGSAKNASGKTKRKSTPISDDELRKRIERLNMEERYSDLVSRQKARESSGFKSTAKKLLGNAAEDLGRQLLSKAIGKLVDRVAGDKKFNIDDYKKMDVNDMDADTIAKVSKWYGDAMKINTSRKNLDSPSSAKNGSNSSTPVKSESDGSSVQPSVPSSAKSSTADYTKRPAWGDKTKADKKQLDDWIKKRNHAINDLRR